MNTSQSNELNPPLDLALIKSIQKHILPKIKMIQKERKSILQSIAKEIISSIEKNGSSNCNFICTHNSRRSHISQIFFQTAIQYYNIINIKSFSGGTEATALNERVIHALEKFGFTIQSNNAKENPIYKIFLSQNSEPILAFSKKYSDPPNPKSNFIAIMTCDHASEHCPVVFGASSKINLHYIDPKISDGTTQEENVYWEKILEIGSEMFALGKLLT